MVSMTPAAVADCMVSQRGRKAQRAPLPSAHLQPRCNAWTRSCCPLPHHTLGAIALMLLAWPGLQS